MANVDEAIDYTLGFEDSTLSGKITETADGKRTRFGIDQHYHPELTNCLFFSSMGSIAALQIARGIYNTSYAEPLCIAQITSQDIANKLLSLGINIGVKPASKMLQAAVGVAEDGVVGVETLMKLSKSDTLQVLADLRASASRYYRQVAADHPEDAEYLNGWLRRANA
jgi:lysozyme family protein